MSFVGKMLVVLQLVLSIVLMCFAGAVSSVQKNWRDAQFKTADALKKKTDELSTLQAEYKKFQDDTGLALKTEKDRADALDAEKRLLTTRLDTLTKDFEAEKKLSASRTELANISTEDNIARKTETVLLREKYKKALDAKDVEFGSKIKLEDQLFELNVELQKLKEDYVTMLRENQKFKEVLVANGLPFELNEYEKKAAPPPIVAGKVLQTLPSKLGGELVTISIGSDDGLAKGHELFVYRIGSGPGEKPKYLGKIQIIDTNPDQATGLILIKAKNGIIQEGDDVTTKLRS